MDEYCGESKKKIWLLSKKKRAVSSGCGGGGNMQCVHAEMVSSFGNLLNDPATALAKNQFLRTTLISPVTVSVKPNAVIPDLITGSLRIS